ncbi:hypothetical protein GCM10010195_62820 [Kitasatospora griseola]|nr:hypothetical protein GCM10010195_62820 [Kitasatospora griseola]
MVVAGSAEAVVTGLPEGGCGPELTVGSGPIILSQDDETFLDPVQGRRCGQSTGQVCTGSPLRMPSM